METFEKKLGAVSEVLKALHSTTDEERRGVWDILVREFDTDPDTYTDRWIPELSKFSWGSQPFTSMYSLEDLARAPRVLPDARFALSLEKGTRGANITFFLESELRFKVTHLTFRGDRQGEMPSAKMLMGVVRSQALSTLKSMELKLDSYTEEQLRMLGEAFELPVQRVRLHGWSGDREMRRALAFFEAFNPPELTGLSISSTKMGASGVRRMASWPVLPGLDLLNISYCRLRDRGLGELCLLKDLAHLSDLNIKGNEITDQGVETFVNATNFSELKALNLFHNKITLRGVEMLASCSKLASLVHLNTGWNSIDERMVEAKILAASPYLSDSASGRVEP